MAREDAAIRRERVETGVVRVCKIVHERHVAINRPVAAPEPPREEGDVLVIPVYEEVVTVQRQWILKEEVRLRRREVQTRHREQVVLRGEEAVVERHAPKSEGST